MATRSQPQQAASHANRKEFRNGDRGSAQARAYSDEHRALQSLGPRRRGSLGKPRAEKIVFDQAE
jgi:hypothetical protein